jgi:hypothetical protein
VQTCKQQKAYEISYIPVAYTVANPWAMMVMNFNTKSTSTTMKRTWGPNDFASGTKTKFIMFVSWVNLQNSILISGIRNEFKFLQMKKLNLGFLNSQNLKLAF